MNRSRFVAITLAVLGFASSIAEAAPARADSRTQAVRIYRRLAGVPPKPDAITSMTQLIDAGKLEAAARVAVDNGDFIDNGAKRLVGPLTDTFGNTQRILSYSTALMLGVIQEDVPFDQVLYSDSFYVGSPAITSTDATPRVLPPPQYAPALAVHFAYLDNNFLAQPQDAFLLNPTNYDDVSHPDLVQRIMTHKFLTKIPQDGFFTYETTYEQPFAMRPPYAGILTAPDFGVSYLVAGTNRRPIKYLMDRFLCQSLDQLMDVTLPDSWVRRDVDRSPGGDSRTYKRRCIGCHSGIDALAGAFAHLDSPNNIGKLYYYDNGQLSPCEQNSEYVPVVEKMNRNCQNYPAGHRVRDSSWVNMWVTPKYASLGWRGATSGTDVKELGQMLARSEAFSNCMAERVFNYACLRSPDTAEEAKLKDIARVFESDMHYSMKSLIARVATEPTCMGGN
jgi:hypothetical protein